MDENVTKDQALEEKFQAKLKELLELAKKKEKCHRGYGDNQSFQ